MLFTFVAFLLRLPLWLQVVLIAGIAVLVSLAWAYQFTHKASSKAYQLAYLASYPVAFLNVVWALKLCMERPSGSGYVVAWVVIPSMFGVLFALNLVWQSLLWKNSR